MGTLKLGKTLALVGALIASPVFGADAKDIKVKSGGPRDPNSTTGDDAEAGESRLIPKAWAENDGYFGVKRRFEKPRSAFWIPLSCFFVPGLDQWWEGQWYGAIGYTGTAVGGFAFASYIAAKNGLVTAAEERPEGDDPAEDAPKEEKKADLDSKNIAVRKVMLGGQLAQWAGGMSTYHAFRTAVRTRKTNLGEYGFLNYEETPWDLMLAPARFDYVIRPSTFIPLAVIGALSYLSLKQEIPADSDIERDAVRPADYFFAGAFSYNAGTHEEAVFRGWLQPWLMEQWGSPFWSNATQSTVFAAAHLNTNPFPIIQLLLGYHLGWVTQKNGYRLGEAIFIHTWWDVVAFVSAYNYKQKAKDEEARLRIPDPTLWLPPFELNF